MTIISEYHGDGEYIDREAVVKNMGGGVLHVEMYDEEGLFKIHRVKGRTVQYAEDLAEDWVMGVTEE
jgi:hypothetical protein